MRSRKGLLTQTSFLVAALWAMSAEAQQRAPASPPPGAARSSSQFTLRREEAGGSDSSVARQRARAGDCAGALPAFDNAIRVTIEPTLRRDRGLCHEKLNDPFPAMDDYRAYLTARADAPDADQIRERLARLEEQTGVGRASAAVKEREETGGAAGGASFSLGTAESTSTTSRNKRSNVALGPRPGEKEQTYDYYLAQERLADAAESSPLRYGTGWIIGPFLHMPRYYFRGGETSDFGFSVGGTARYAWSSSATFITELGYVGFGTQGEASQQGGPIGFVGVEWRFALDTWASNQLYLGIGPGFERYVNSQTKIGLTILEVRARFGYRHVFGPRVALEIGVDGGQGVGFGTGNVASVNVGSAAGVNQTDSTEATTVVSGALAFVIGF